jgi:hypothetical protein
MAGNIPLCGVDWVMAVLQVLQQFLSYANSELMKTIFKMFCFSMIVIIKVWNAYNLM